MTEFSNPKLQEIYENSKKFVQDHLEKLDNISRDIKQMESFLSKSAICPHEETFSLPEGKGWFALEYQKGKIYYRDSYMSNALIETKIAIRLKVAPYLEQFLEKAIENSQV